MNSYNLIEHEFVIFVETIQQMIEKIVWGR